MVELFWRFLKLVLFGSEGRTWALESCWGIIELIIGGRKRVQRVLRYVDIRSVMEYIKANVVTGEGLGWAQIETF